MASVPDTDQKPVNRHARRVAGLLSEVLDCLRFYAETGYNGEYCSSVNLERIEQWAAPGGLLTAGRPVDNGGGPAGCLTCPLRSDRNVAPVEAEATGKKLMFVLGYPALPPAADNTPFAGEAGRLLARIVAAMHLSTDDIYVSHVVKCRPPGEREPSTDETRCCLPLLKDEITAVTPDVICVFGGFAARALLDRPEPLARLRGRFYEKNGVRIMPTWHPDDMLDDPEKKRPAWADLQKVMRSLDIT